MRSKIYIPILIGLMFVFFSINKAAAQQIQPSALKQIQSLIDEKASRTPAQQKLNSQLWYAIKMDRGEPISREVSTLDINVNKDGGGKVPVEIYAAPSALLLQTIRNAGGEIITSSQMFSRITANVPLKALEQLASNADIKFIDMALPASHAGKSIWDSRKKNEEDPTYFVGKTAFKKSEIQKYRPGFLDRAAKISQQVTDLLHAQDFKIDNPYFVGNANSQGDVTHKAALARSTFSVNGSGVKIGILSDSYDTRSTGLNASDDVTNGDLPGTTNPNGFTTPVTVIEDHAAGTDEGRAMLQIVHDLAPGAQLYFATAFTSEPGFASNILALQAAGCTIICDDVFYFDEPPFQDGIVAQAVNTVTAAGVSYFSSAGNQGNKNDNSSSVWEGDFADAGTLALLPGGNLHDFGGGNNSNALTTNGADRLFLFWSDPQGASANDYDLYILNAGMTAVLTSSTSVQNGSQNPMEFITSVRSTGQRMVIFKKTGAATRALHLNIFGDGMTFNTPGQTHGHGSATNAFSVAATPAATAFCAGFTNGPATTPFTSANKVECFSSDGPRRKFYTPSGVAITPGNLLFGTSGGELLQKPDITAADGVATTLPTTSGLNPFYGTSAAAPHAAAIAVLLRAYRPAITATQIRNALVASAIDIETAGTDRDAGVGIVMAFEALQAATGPTVTINQAVGQADPTSVAPINFTVVFSSPVTGFTTGDVTLSGTAGATTATVTGSGNTYNVAVTGMTSSGTVIATVGAGVAIDAGTFPNLSSTSTDNTVNFNLVVAAGPVTVTATAGTVGPTDYNTVKLAFDAINGGTHQGAVTVSVNASTDEGATPALLNSSGTGSSSYTSVLVRPTADNISIVGGATPASRGVIELNGADNVTIDGDNPNTAGTNRNLTVTLTGTSGVGLIWLKSASASDGATNNTIKNCILKGQGQTATTICILGGSSTFGGAAAIGNAGTTISNNAISKAQNGIYWNGFATAPNYDANLSITNNTFGSTVAADKHIFRGMILQNVSNFTISNNTIQGVASTTTSTSNMSGIQLAGAGNGGNIFNNKISDIKQTNTTGFGAEGITLGFTTTASNINVYNNFISDIAGQGWLGTSTPTNGFSVSDNGNGIAIVAGGGYNVYYNTVHMNTNQTNNGNPSALLINTVATANSLNIRNNIFTNSQTTGTNRFSIVSVPANTVFADINYNDYFTAGPNLGNIGGTNRANLAAVQAGTGKDANSVSDAVTFVSATDLHLVATTVNCSVNGKATPIAGITTDIDADTRNATTPDIGADEINVNCNPCVITCPANQTAIATNGLCGAVVNYPAPTSTGSCGTITATPASGAFFPVGTTTVNVVSSSGSTCSFTVTVTDNQNPTITCPANISRNADAGVCTASVAVPNATTADNCSVTKLTWVMTGATTGTSPATGINNLGTQTFNNGVTTIVYTVSDAANNTATCTFTVTVTDNQAPVVTCPGNMTATTPIGSCTANVVTPNPTTSDNCGVTVLTWALTGATTGTSPATGINNLGTRTFNIGQTTVTYTVKDAANNSSTCTFTVTVADGQLPVISVQPANRTVCEGSSATFTVTATNVVTYQWQFWNGTAWVNTGTNSSSLSLPAVTVSQNTNTYHVILNGLCTQVVSGNATLFVNKLPIVTIAASRIPILLPGESVNITATTIPGGGSYVWFKNGVIIPGVSGSSLVGLTVDDIGTYKTTYTDPNGCVSTSGEITVSGAPSGNVFVFPNPNLGQFSIRFNNAVGDPATITVFDAKGARVFQRQMVTTTAYTKLDVDLGSSSSGVYIVEVRSSNGKLVGAKRIIVRHQ